jgi:hypothetical protein
MNARKTKRGTKLDAVAEVLANLNPKCIATIVPADDGEVFLILMKCPDVVRCPRCTDARARLRETPTSTPTATPRADARPAEEDEL